MTDYASGVPGSRCPTCGAITGFDGVCAACSRDTVSGAGLDPVTTCETCGETVDAGVVCLTCNRAAFAREPSVTQKSPPFQLLTGEGRGRTLPLLAGTSLGGTALEVTSQMKYFDLEAWRHEAATAIFCEQLRAGKADVEEVARWVRILEQALLQEYSR